MASWLAGRVFSTLIVLAVLFGACSEKQQVPEGVVSRNEMVHLMIQVHLIEAKVQNLALMADTAQQVYDHFEKLMLEKEGVDSADFKASYRYYSQRPKIFSKIYAAVVDSLLEMESKERFVQAEQSESEEPTKIDSDSAEMVINRPDSIKTSQYINRDTGQVKLKKPKQLRKQ